MARLSLSPACNKPAMVREFGILVYHGNDIAPHASMHLNEIVVPASIAIRRDCSFGSLGFIGHNYPRQLSDESLRPESLQAVRFNGRRMHCPIFNAANSTAESFSAGVYFANRTT